MYLIHGHGGIWTGCANSSKGLVEKDLTLKIANYLKALEKFGLITIAHFYEGQVPMMRLVKFSTTISL